VGETGCVEAKSARLVAYEMPFLEVALAVPNSTIAAGNLPNFPGEILNRIRLLAPAQALGELGV
jgi:hypothetical protein